MSFSTISSIPLHHTPIFQKICESMPRSVYHQEERILVTLKILSDSGMVVSGSLVVWLSNYLTVRLWSHISLFPKFSDQLIVIGNENKIGGVSCYECPIPLFSEASSTWPGVRPTTHIWFEIRKKKLQCSGLKYFPPIPTNFCTRNDSVTVVTCAKFRCDRLSIL